MYQKDFDSWNIKKKQIHRNLFRIAHTREVWWCSLGVNVGFEQDDKHEFFERPVLILRVFNKEMIWILPVTSTIKESPFYYDFIFNDLKQSVMITQIRTISSKRLRRKIGTISDLDFKNILEFLIKFIKNETPPKGGESWRPKPLIT